MRLRDGRLELDADLMRLHESNVQTAIDYRARMLSSLLEMMQSIEF